MTEQQQMLVSAIYAKFQETFIMQDLNIPRSLIYKDKENLYDFIGEESYNSMERQFFYRLVNRPFIKSTDKAPEYVLRIFNDATYLCTLIYFELHPALYLNKYINKLKEDLEDEFGSHEVLHILPATMALVYNWLNTSWYREQKKYGDGCEYAIDVFLGNVYYEFIGWDVKFTPEYKEDFYALLLKDAHRTYWGKSDKTSISYRQPAEAIEDNDVSIRDIVEGVDYFCDMCDGDKEYDSYLLTKTLNRLKRDSKIVEDKESYKQAKSKVESRLFHLGYWPEADNKDSNEIIKQEKAFNDKTGLPCFTSRQMGILLTAIGRITEKDNPPGKTTLGDVVEKIAGYGKSTANSNMKGKIPQTDTEVVANAIESKFPNLATEVRKLSL